MVAITATGTVDLSGADVMLPPRNVVVTKVEIGATSYVATGTTKARYAFLDTTITSGGNDILVEAFVPMRQLDSIHTGRLWAALDSTDSSDAVILGYIYGQSDTTTNGLYIYRFTDVPAGTHTVSFWWDNDSAEQRVELLRYSLHWAKVEEI